MVFSRGRKHRENFEKIFGKLLYVEVGEKKCTPHGACEACKCEKGRRLLLSGDIPLKGNTTTGIPTTLTGILLDNDLR